MPAVTNYAARHHQTAISKLPRLSSIRPIQKPTAQVKKDVTKSVTTLSMRSTVGGSTTNKGNASRKSFGFNLPPQPMRTRSAAAKQTTANATATAAAADKGKQQTQRLRSLLEQQREAGLIRFEPDANARRSIFNGGITQRTSSSNHRRSIYGRKPGTSCSTDSRLTAERLGEALARVSTLDEPPCFANNSMVKTPKRQSIYGRQISKVCRTPKSAVPDKTPLNLTVDQFFLTAVTSTPCVVVTPCGKAAPSSSIETKMLAEDATSQPAPTSCLTAEGSAKKNRNAIALQPLRVRFENGVDKIQDSPLNKTPRRLTQEYEKQYSQYSVSELYEELRLLEKRKTTVESLLQTKRTSESAKKPNIRLLEPIIERNSYSSQSGDISSTTPSSARILKGF